MFAAGATIIRDICGCFTSHRVCVCVCSARDIFASTRAGLWILSPSSISAACRSAPDTRIRVSTERHRCSSCSKWIRCVPDCCDCSVRQSPLSFSLIHELVHSPICNLIDIVRFMNICTCIRHANDVVYAARDRMSELVCVLREWVLFSSPRNCKNVLLLSSSWFIKRLVRKERKNCGQK